MKKISKYIVSLLLIVAMISPALANEHDESDGSVTLTKNANWLDKENNIVATEMSVQGKNIPLELEKRTIDVVLVVDLSGSMSQKIKGRTKIESLKDASFKLIDALLDQDAMDDNLEIRIALVPFRTRELGSENGYHDLSSNKESLKKAVNKFSPYGGTNVSAGILSASEILAKSKADDKQMIVLTDGEPNYHYKAASATTVNDMDDYSYASTQLFGGSVILNAGKNKNGQYSLVGNGNTVQLVWDRYSVKDQNNNKVKVRDNAQPTISAAYLAKKNLGIKITGIVYGKEEYENNRIIMRAVASKGNDTYHEANEDLIEVFSDIAQTITSIPGARDAIITETLGANNSPNMNQSYQFEIVENSIKTYINDVLVDNPLVSYDANTRTIQWILEGPLDESKTYKMTYQSHVAIDGLVGEQVYTLKTSSRSSVDYYDVRSSKRLTEEFKTSSVQVVNYIISTFYNNQKDSNYEVRARAYDSLSDNIITDTPSETITKDGISYDLEKIIYGQNPSAQDLYLGLDVSKNTVDRFYHKELRNIKVNYYLNETYLGTDSVQTLNNDISVNVDLMKTEELLNANPEYFNATYNAEIVEKMLTIQLDDTTTEIDIIYRNIDALYGIQYIFNGEEILRTNHIEAPYLGSYVNVQAQIDAMKSNLANLIEGYPDNYVINVTKNDVLVEDLNNDQITSDSTFYIVKIVPKETTFTVAFYLNDFNQEALLTISSDERIQFGTEINLEDFYNAHYAELANHIGSDIERYSARYFRSMIQQQNSKVSIDADNLEFQILLSIPDIEYSIDYFIDDTQEENYLGSSETLYTNLGTEVTIDTSAFKNHSRFLGKNPNLYEAYYEGEKVSSVRIDAATKKIQIVYQKARSTFEIRYIDDETGTQFAKVQGDAELGRPIQTNAEDYRTLTNLGSLFEHYQVISGQEDHTVVDGDNIIEVHYGLRNYNLKLEYYKDGVLWKETTTPYKAGSSAQYDTKMYLNEEHLGKDYHRYNIENESDLPQSFAIFKDTEIKIYYAKDPVKPEPVKPEPVKPEPVKPKPVKPEPVKPDTSTKETGVGEPPKGKDGKQTSSLPKTGVSMGFGFGSLFIVAGALFYSVSKRRDRKSE